MRTGPVGPARPEDRDEMPATFAAAARKLITSLALALELDQTEARERGGSWDDARCALSSGRPARGSRIG